MIFLHKIDVKFIGELQNNEIEEISLRCTIALTQSTRKASELHRRRAEKYTMAEGPSPTVLPHLSLINQS